MHTQEYIEKYEGLINYADAKPYIDPYSTSESDALYFVGGALYELAVQQARTNDLLARIVEKMEAK